MGVFLVLISAAPSHSKIYKWKDENGKTHFTDSPSKIPPQYRKKDELKTFKGAPADPSTPVKLLLPEVKPTSQSIPVEPYGDGHFLVEVLINGKIKAKLMVDSGATMISLSERIGDILRVTNNKDLPIVESNTAGGKIKSPLFILDSFKVGPFEEFNLEANTIPHFKEKGVDGLLGMNFLGEFKMELDRKNSKLLLDPNLVKGEMLWGGHNEAWWRKKYETYVKEIHRIQIILRKYMMEPKERINFIKLLRHYENLHKGFELRADQVSLPKEFRSYP